MGFFNDRVSRMDALDVGLTKFSSIAFALFLITIWPAAMDWVQSVNAWYFLVAGIIIAARPIYRVYFK